MADYAIGLSFVKANRTLVRAVELTPPNRYFATRGDDGFVTLPTLATGQSYIELQGVKASNFQVSDNATDFRLFGDDGWTDSVITGSRVQASCQTFFMKDTEIPAGQSTPIFRGNYEEGFALIEKARYNKNYEVYVEFLKELGPANGSTGDYIYDFTGFNCVLMNFQEQRAAEGLVDVSFEMMSRGRPVFGKYNAGGSPIKFGGVQSTLLFLQSGVRQAAVSPVNNASAVAVGVSPTVTYTSDGTVALTQLALGDASGSGFRLENASTGVAVPTSVSISGNVVTVDPISDLASGTIYRLRVSDGAVKQAVDGTGAPSANGIQRPIQGLTTTFRTA